jgi:alanine racemase
VSGGPERAVARVDLGAVERNCTRLADLLGEGAQLCAVVKADGYGHGAVPCAQAAMRGGASWLAVATAQEAAELRAAGIDSRVLVMGALTRAELRIALEADADIVAWTDDVLTWADHAARVHVKLDSGMGRLGTRDPEEATRVARLAAERHDVVGAMTHFATADDDPAFVADQLEVFTPWAEAMRAEHPGLIVHAANSAATLREPASRFDLVRCGIAIYGLDPFQENPAEHGLEPALTLASYVAEAKTAAPGQSAGYGRRFVADAPTCVGTVPIGYADGVRRALTNNADVLVQGRRVPLIGAVSMDNITVDLGAGGAAAVGEEAVLIGRQGEQRILAEEVARRLGTINYEVTCGISGRVPRAYVS